jgi:hypothetical protein
MPSIARSLEKISSKGEVKPIDRKLIRALDNCIYLAEDQVEELQKFEDADTIGTYLQDIERVKRFMRESVSRPKD